VIEEIRLHGLGVIADAVLAPHPGFTVLTGETGAGKTMVLTALGLLLGGKADAGKVGSGSRTEVEGRFQIRAGSSVIDRVQLAGGQLDDGELVLARTVTGEGRSRAYAGGRAVPVGVLSELSDALVAVHGQSDQHRLLLPATQRETLDRYAGEDAARPYGKYRQAWQRLREVERELVELTSQARERAREADLLRIGVAEIDAAAPQPDEADRLRAESGRLGYAESLREAATVAQQALTGDESAVAAQDALSQLVFARRSLDAQRDHDSVLAALADRVAEVASLTTDVAADLAGYAASVDADPLRLGTVEDRRAVLGTLTRKYGDTIEEVLGWSAVAAARLRELDGDDGRIGELAAEQQELQNVLRCNGSELSAARRDAALRLGKVITGELIELAMPHAAVTVEVRAASAPGAHGDDEIELLLTAHAGAPARPLAAAASGGELSRVMLALEVVLAGSDPVPTMVFDEVDAGVGGKAAVEVGRRLARLSRTTQVLVVTHLPQVAAFADRQIVVEKSDDGSVTTSGLRIVEGAERTRELARMLAGLDSSDAAATHADELLALAEQERMLPTNSNAGKKIRKGR
jgi:DNA repair protein RecN (Recombination protein N)